MSPHRSVGAIIKDNDKILMLDRANFPFGWACPAGHIEENETPETALAREVLEETGLVVKKYHLVWHEFVDWNECKRGVRGHDWHGFEVTELSGEIQNNKESKSIAWIPLDKIKDLALESVWEYWFKKLKII